MGMNTANVSVDAISKRYGDLKAVDSVSFELGAGRITGLIGPNGAGKTTIIRILSTLIEPDEGSVSVRGFDVVREPDKVRASIGVMPEHPGAYLKLTVRENLRFYASFYDVADCESLIRAHAGDLDLLSKLDTPVGELSKGMKEKVAFIRAIIHDPEVIVLDEPFTGLDPDSRVTIKRQLGSLRERERTILISSHDLALVEAICDTVILLDHGSVLVDESIESLKRRFSESAFPSLESIYLELRKQT